MFLTSSWFHWTIGGFVGFAWAWRVLDALFGFRHVPDIAQSKWDLPAGDARVTVVVPARNEEECIGLCLKSLLALEYPNLEIVAIDDRSTDSTGAIMESIAALPTARGRLRIIHVTELPEGWLGKTHAMWVGGKPRATDAAQSAQDANQSGWLLFTDGDIMFRADCLRRAIAYGERASADHVVIFPSIIMHTMGENMMMSAFQGLFIFACRFWRVADPKVRDHLGVGAFNLIRRSAYEGLGTYKALRLEVVDDIKLGEAVKRHGYAQRVVMGVGLVSLRWAEGALGVVKNLTKNFFSFFGYRWYVAVIAAVFVFLLSISPFVFVWFAPGWSKLGYIVAIASILVAYIRMAPISQVSPIYFLTHPIAACLVIYTIVNSTVTTLRDGGITWRGTKYSLDTLRQKQDL